MKYKPVSCKCNGQQQLLNVFIFIDYLSPLSAGLRYYCCCFLFTYAIQQRLSLTSPLYKAGSTQS